MSSILFLLPTDVLGGAESTLKKLCRYFLMNGHSVDVVFISGKDTGTWGELTKYHTLNLIHLKSTRELFGFPRCLWYFFADRLKGRGKYNLSFTSHTHCNAFLSFCVSVGLLSVDNIVLRESTNVFSWFEGLKLKFVHSMYLFYSRKALIICQTNKMRTDFIENVKWINPNKVIVIENPVEFGLLDNMALQPCDEDVDILAVGRLVREKAYDVLLQSFALVLCRYPERKLTIVGAGNQFEFIVATINNLNLQNSVVLKGAMSNPYNYMKKSNISVLSSRLEGFPNVLFEMMALSTSVVSTICADGIASLPGIYTCQTESAECLADALLNAIEEDSDTKYNNVASMRAKVQTLTVESYVRKIYQNLVNY